MFRILLEINDLSLLKTSKPQLLAEIVAAFSELGGETGEFIVEGNLLQNEIEDASARFLAGQLMAFRETLYRRKGKLHGFILGLDYAPRQRGFRFDLGGSWGRRLEKLDTLLISQAAYAVVEPYLALEECAGHWRATALKSRPELSTEAFESLASPDNLSMVRQALVDWQRSGGGERPLFIHRLAPAEQYRMALASALAGGTAKDFLLVDLNYPWRSPLAAFVGCFGPELVQRIGTMISEEHTKRWETCGKGLMSGLNLFCVEDALLWLGEALNAYGRLCRGEFGGERRTPILVICGAEKLNRPGKLIAARLLEPLHRRGELFCLLLGNAPPASRRSSFSFAAFHKAPQHGEAAPPPSPSDRPILELAAYFSPFLRCGELRRRLYEGGYEKHRVDELLAEAGVSGSLFSTWRYLIAAPAADYRPHRSRFAAEALKPFFSKLRNGEAGPFVCEYAFLAADLLPGAGEGLYVDLLRSLYERSYGLSGSSVSSLFRRRGRRMGEFKRAYEALRRARRGDAKGRPGRTPEFRSSEIESMVLSLQGDEFLRQGDVDSALSGAKSFLFRVQESDQPCQIAEAQNAIGQAMLRQGKIEEANDYFSLSYESSKGCTSPADRLRARINQGLSLFLFGNYSRSERVLTEGEEAAMGLCHGPDLLLSAFLKARISFKLGRYADAEERFWRVLSLATLTGVPHDLFYAWIGRCRVYAGESAVGGRFLMSLPKSPEVFYYRAEERYFSGDIRGALKAIRAAGRGLKADRGPRGGFGRYHWDTGYRNIEDCTFLDSKGRGVLYTSITSFRTYLESRSEGRTEGMEILERITRTERLGDLDPFLHFYFLIQALLISEETHNEALERITYLSKGLKYLQRIGSVIDEVPARLDFLQKNRWNRYLMDLAREEKLA